MLATIISQITRIDTAYLLRKKALDCASIAKRMSWASKRTTTRVEDAAYCLLGIFGLSMPLLYGEGEMAFIRMQEEIMKHSDDQSLIAWGELGSATSASNEPRGQTRTQFQIRGLFARFPSDFSDCGDIMCDEVAAVSEPYALTNMGVRLSLPLFNDDSFPSTPQAILAYRPERSLLHIIALPLKELGGG